MLFNNKFKTPAFHGSINTGVNWLNITGILMEQGQLTLPGQEFSMAFLLVIALSVIYRFTTLIYFLDIVTVFHISTIILGSWVHDAPGVIKRVTDRVSLLTGLATLNCTEPYQVVNYGIGGMYHPHLDALETDMKDDDVLYKFGDRIATWMFYLNDVTAGGATVFPQVNARVPVVKGGAAFWYNLLPSGECDKRTLHAGCPVLLGSKWIGNKWIREAGQIFKRPCDLQP